MSDTRGGSTLFVFVVADFLPALGGTSTQTNLLGRGLHAAGADVHVVTRRLDRSSPRVETIGGLVVHRLGGPGRRGSAEKRALVSAARWLRRNRRRVQAVQIIQWYDAAFAAAAAELTSRTAVLWAAAGDATDLLDGRRGSPLRRAIVRQRKRLLGRCRHQALSEEIASELRSLQLPEAHLVPLPVDTERFRPPAPDERRRAREDLGFGPDDFVVAYCGYLRRLKRVDLLIESVAVARARGVPVKLLLIGGERGAADDVGDQLRAQASAADLDTAVVFTGEVQDPERLLWAADAFALASEREGLPNVLLEAMACGLPCIAPPSAAGNVALSGGGGVVPPDNAPASFASAFADLHADPARRREMGATGRQQAEGHAMSSVLPHYMREWEHLQRG